MTGTRVYKVIIRVRKNRTMNPKLRMSALLAAAGILTVGAFSALTPNTIAAPGAGTSAKAAPDVPFPKPDKNGKVVLTDAQWHKRLTPAQYNILRQEGTEAPYSHPYTNLHDKGIFVCAGCGLPLFAADTKFDSGTGWPSFYQPIQKSAVRNVVDKTIGMERTEVRCSRCEGHLGHVFNDGPKPTGLRYCMDGLALKFVPAPKK